MLSPQAGTGTSVLVTRLSDLYPVPVAACNGISVQDANGRTVAIDLFHWELGETRSFEFQIDSDNFTAENRNHPSWWSEVGNDSLLPLFGP